MKKGVEIAFAVTLVILAIIATVFPSEITESITCAVICPSFILTVISFVSDIMKSCESSAEKLGADASELADITNQVAIAKEQNYSAGVGAIPYTEGVIPKEIYDKKKESFDYLKTSVEYAKSQIFFIQCRRVCNVVIVAGYILLFLSLCLSPIIATWLLKINLGSITLWSLAVLYVTLELKEEICKAVFRFLHKLLKKRLNIDSLFNDTDDFSAIGAKR